MCAIGQRFNVWTVRSVCARWLWVLWVKFHPRKNYTRKLNAAVNFHSHTVSYQKQKHLQHTAMIAANWSLDFLRATIFTFWQSNHTNNNIGEPRIQRHTANENVYKIEKNNEHFVGALVRNSNEHLWNQFGNGTLNFDPNRQSESALLCLDFSMSFMHMYYVRASVPVPVSVEK